MMQDCLQVGDQVPDVSATALEGAWEATQSLLRQRIISAGHDVGDGGVAVTLLEMAFAGNCGLQVRALCAPSLAPQQGTTLVAFNVSADVPAAIHVSFLLVLQRCQSLMVVTELLAISSGCCHGMHSVSSLSKFKIGFVSERWCSAWTSQMSWSQILEHKANDIDAWNVGGSSRQRCLGSPVCRRAWLGTGSGPSA